jgi:NADH:ubiquinone reductase (H+-translocating)
MTDAYNTRSPRSVPRAGQVAGGAQLHQAPDAVIAVLGGGYAGLFAARRAARALARTSAGIVLVDSGDSWQERTRWHQVAAGETVRSRSRAHIFRGTRVETVSGSVTGIDLDGRTLTFRDREPLAFDRLVYAAGSRSNATAIPGAAAHAHTLDTPETSKRIAAAIAERPDSRVLVVGGGLTGIQTAAQLARRHRTAHVTLVSSAAIGSELPGPAQARAARALAGLGVAIMEKCRVEAVEPGGVRWADGQIAADLVVWTAGFTPSPLAAQAGLAVTGAGQVVVDAALRSVSHPFVFAAGDGAAVPRAGSAYGAYAATTTGATAGQNAGLDLAGRPVTPLNMGYSFLAASLGPGRAVVQLLRPDGTPRRQVLTGKPANALKEAVEHYVVFGVTAERTLPGVYRWAPAPKPRKKPGTAGTAGS